MTREKFDSVALFIDKIFSFDFISLLIVYNDAKFLVMVKRTHYNILLQ